MARVIATGSIPTDPYGPSIGSAIGGAFGDVYRQQRDKRAALEQYEPMRAALEQSLGAMTSQSPIQAALSALVKDPEAFSQTMTDPKGLEKLQTVGQMAAPGAVEDPDPELTNMLRALDISRQYAAAGDHEAAGMLKQRAIKAAGFDPSSDEGARMLANIEDAYAASKEASAQGKHEIAELYMDRARTLAGRKAKDAVEFPQMAEMMELVDQANYYRGLGDTKRADLLEARANDLAGIGGSADNVPAIVKTVTAMGLDPSVGRGRELLEASIMGSQRADLRTQRIDAMVEMGVDPETATKIEDGRLTRKVNPVTGRVILTDDITGEVTEVPVSQTAVVNSAMSAGSALGEPEPLSGQPGQTLWDLAEVGTGPASAFDQAVSYPLSLLGLPFPEQTVFARKIFDAEVQNFLRAMSLNSRFPVAELERLRKDLGAMSSVFSSPARLRSEMQGLNASLRSSAAQFEQNASNPDLPQSDRADWSRASQDIQYFLKVMGVPSDQQTPGQQRGTQTAAPQRAQPLPEGIPPGSTVTGELNGAPVYTAPDGRQFVAE